MATFVTRNSNARRKKDIEDLDMELVLCGKVTFEVSRTCLFG